MLVFIEIYIYGEKVRIDILLAPNVEMQTKKSIITTISSTWNATYSLIN